MDQPGFRKWLLGQGVPEAHLPAYLKATERIAAIAGDGPIYPKHVDEAIRRDESAGATPKALANLQRIGELAIQFQAQAHPTGDAPPPSVRCAGCGTSQPPSASGNCVMCGKGLPRLEVAPIGAGGERRCRACGGSIEYHDGQSAGASGGGAGAIGGAAAGYFLGLLGALTVAFGVMALGSLVALLSLKFRCSSCWESWPARLLDRDERIAMAKQRLVYLVAALGLGALSVGCGIAWVVVGAHRFRGRLH